MPKRRVIQLQGSIRNSLKEVTNDMRSTVSKACLGVDDMQLLGNKALVLRAEIYPGKLNLLYESLQSLGINLDRQSLPEATELLPEVEYPLSIQITSFSDDTDNQASIPKVPG